MPLSLSSLCPLLGMSTGVLCTAGSKETGSRGSQRRAAPTACTRFATAAVTARARTGRAGKAERGSGETGEGAGRGQRRPARAWPPAAPQRLFRGALASKRSRACSCEDTSCDGRAGVLEQILSAVSLVSSGQIAFKYFQYFQPFPSLVAVK